jgi:hypothetical protein
LQWSSNLILAPRRAGFPPWIFSASQHRYFYSYVAKGKLKALSKAREKGMSKFRIANEFCVVEGLWKKRSAFYNTGWGTC